MLTFDLTLLARRLDCLPALEAARGKKLSPVGWRFLAAMLREMPVESDRTRALVDPVIAGMDRLAAGGDWQDAWAAAAPPPTPPFLKAAWAATLAAAAAAEAEAAEAGEWALVASAWAAKAGLPYKRQREILVRLMEAAG